MTSTSDIPAGDFFLSLNGFDEVGIAKEFGESVEVLRARPFMFLRALAFVHQRREGLKSGDAYKAAMELPVSDLQDYFADEAPEELDPDDPDTPAGKEPSPSG